MPNLDEFGGYLFLVALDGAWLSRSSLTENLVGCESIFESIPCLTRGSSFMELLARSKLLLNLFGPSCLVLKEECLVEAGAESTTASSTVIIWGVPRLNLPIPFSLLEAAVSSWASDITELSFAMPN